MLQEIRILRSVSFDRNIVQFCGACLQPTDTMMILEYMAVGSAKLLQCLKQNVMIVCNTAKLSVFTISCSQAVSPSSASYKKVCLCLIISGIMLLFLLAVV